MAHAWSIENEGYQLLDTTVVTTSVEGTQLGVDHGELIQHEDVLCESMNRCAHVESDIVDQELIRDTAIATLIKLETCLEDVTEAEGTTTRNQEVSATKYDR